MPVKMVQANGVKICTETFGDPADPVVLLISGAAESMLWWEDDLCRLLVDGGRQVIRYDHRDTGLSVTYPPGNPTYHLDDLVEDAVRVLDAYGIGSAHIVGLSLGGIIAQLIAIRHSERVRSITLISSTPHGPEDPDLPPMDERILAHFRDGASLDWSDRAAVIDFMVAGRRLLVPDTPSTKRPHERSPDGRSSGRIT
jgi:pimeloyl-ACP methyl ester carboxylesterase